LKFGLTTRVSNASRVALATTVYKHLSADHEVIIESTLSDSLGADGTPLDEIDCDILIAIGGDGTVLYTVQNNPSKVFCINAGSLGFLTDSTPDQAIGDLDRIIRGDYIVDPRQRLKTTLDGRRLPDALNETVVHSANPSKIRDFIITIDGATSDTIRSDGIIIATPTGSTGYSMSAGGPLIDPRVEAFIFTPIAPFRLTARPTVVPMKSSISVQIKEAERPSRLVIDGQVEEEVDDTSEIILGVSETPAEFIRFRHDFYNRVSEKLGAPQYGNRPALK